LRQQIRGLHESHRCALGAVKTWRVLNAGGIICGKHRVARLRKDEGIEARRKVKFRVMKAHQHTEPPAPDLLKRAFTVTAPNKVWVSDITTIHTGEGWLHLAIVLDLFARRIVGWAMSQCQDATLPIAALRMAYLQREPAPGLICHTDQGSVYGSSTYRQLLNERGLRASMSRRGNCHDNAWPRAGSLLYDLFHVVAKYGREVIDRVRVDEANRLKHDLPMRKVVKRARWLLLRNRANIPAEKLASLDELLAANRTLSTVYIMKAALKELWSAQGAW
jgi:hypothetical protein